MSDSVSAEQLRQYIERAESMNAEIKALQDDRNDVYAEMKATGFDVKTVKQIIKLRAMEKHHRDEAAALLETYMGALGL